MKLWSAPYILQPRAGQTSRAGASGRLGTLLRYDSDAGSTGYADLFPWPELGDAPLPEQLERLVAGDLTPLLERSLACARQDAEARAEDRSLFAGVEVPASHYLAPGVDALERLSPSDLTDRGFDRVKLKLGGDLEAELDALMQQPAELRWRLDVNARVSCAALARGLERLDARWAAGNADLASRIDFIEDPCPYTESDWRGLRDRFGVGLALDFEQPGGGIPAATHRIIKPAAEDPEAVAQWAVQHGLRLVVTSYLDHPVGQLHAARAAGVLRARYGDSMDCCGLLSQDAYRPTAYSDALPVRGATLDTADLGPGIGLGGLLENEEWLPL